MKNLYYIKGREVIHSMYCAPYMGKSVELIGGISDWGLEHIESNNVAKCGISVTPSLDIPSGDITLYNTYVFATEYREANKKEIALFNKKLAEKNLVFETRKYIRVYGKTEQVEDYLATYYIDKDNFRISLNKNVIHYKDLRNIKFDDDDKFIFRGDNGYSHCWVDTTKANANKVIEYIDSFFRIPSKDKDGITNNYSFQSVATGGGHHGYEFNQYGELVLETTKRDIHFDEVSNS